MDSFLEIYLNLCGILYNHRCQQLNKLVQNKVHKKLHDKYAICPIDSTIITLTSKLLWVLGHHQVKLFSSLNLSTGSPEDNLINFGIIG